MLVAGTVDRQLGGGGSGAGKVKAPAAQPGSFNSNNQSAAAVE